MHRLLRHEYVSVWWLPQVPKPQRYMALTLESCNDSGNPSTIITSVSELVALLDRLSQLAATPLLVALAVSTIFILLFRNWRIVLPALIVQYVIVGIMLARVIQPGVALIKPLAGALVCLALSIAAQRADDVRSKRGESVAVERIRHVAWRSVPAQVLLRAIAAVLVLTAAYGATVRFPLPGGARELGLGAYALLASGILLIAIAPEALNIGVGLLMFLSGVELGYTPLEPSISVSVLIGFMTLAVGIAIAYLTLADGSALVDLSNTAKPSSTAVITKSAVE